MKIIMSEDELAAAAASAMRAKGLKVKAEKVDIKVNQDPDTEEVLSVTAEVEVDDLI